MDMSVVKNGMLPKTVLIMAIKLPPLKGKSYKRFPDDHGFKVSSDKTRKKHCFAGYQALPQDFVLDHLGFILPMGSVCSNWACSSRTEIGNSRNEASDNKGKDNKVSSRSHKT